MISLKTITDDYKVKREGTIKEKSGDWGRGKNDGLWEQRIYYSQQIFIVSSFNFLLN